MRLVKKPMKEIGFFFADKNSTDYIPVDRKLLLQQYLMHLPGSTVSVLTIFNREQLKVGAN